MENIDLHEKYKKRVAEERKIYKDTIVERDKTIRRLLDITGVLEGSIGDKNGEVVKLTKSNKDLTTKLEKASLDLLELQKQISELKFTKGQAFMFLADAIKNRR